MQNKLIVSPFEVVFLNQDSTAFFAKLWDFQSNQKPSSSPRARNTMQVLLMLDEGREENQNLLLKILS